MREWKDIPPLEAIAETRLSKELDLFQKAAQEIYQAAIEIPELHSEFHSHMCMRVSGILLKRVLTDLRAVWLLITRGYTSQAACVAAALYENALAAACVAGSPEFLTEIEKRGYDGFPPAKELCKKFANKCKDGMVPIKESPEWKEVYSTYKYLCQIKHPTLKSLIHDASSTETTPGNYAFFVQPNGSSNDLALKRTLLFACLFRSLVATYQHLCALGLTDESASSLRKRLIDAQALILQAYDKCKTSTLPFGIGDPEFEREPKPTTKKKEGS